MSLPPIVAKVTADTSGLVKGLADGEKRLSTFAKVGAASVAAVAAGLIALTKASLANVDAMAKQARSLGLTVAAFQKMSLVAEEAGIEAGKLTSMLGLMQRNIAELQAGTAKQTQTFNALGLSLSELQGMAPDEQFAKIADKLDAISDPAQKTALAMELFGRSGRDAINMLSGYSAAVADAERFQRNFGITLTETEANSIERANDAVGRISLAFEGLGNRLAVIVAPALENAANGFIMLMESIIGAESKSIGFFQTMDNYSKIIEDFGSVDVAAAMAGGWNNLEAILAQSNAPELLDEMRKGYENLQTVTAYASRAMASDLVMLSAHYPILSKAMGQMLSEVLRLSEAMRNALDAGDVEAAAQFRAELEIAVQNLQNAADSASALGGVDMSATVGWATALAGQLGVVAQAAMDAADAIASIPSAVVGGATGDDERGSQRRIVHDATAFTRDNPRRSSGGGGGGGGGGGLEDQLAQRLETLQEGLQTEAEMVAEWYATSQQTLEEALAAKMLTETEYMEARERLEQEHQERLQGIREAGNQWSLSSAFKAGAEILGAMGSSNKKIIKAQKAFAAAAALIDTYQGAAAELKKGTFGFASAAAVIAKGMAFISAIKGAGDGGSGGGSGGGRSSAAAASSAPPVQRLLIDYQGPQAAFGSFAALVDMMNAAGKAGYVLNAEITGAR